MSPGGEDAEILSRVHIKVKMVLFSGSCENESYRKAFQMLRTTSRSKRALSA
jgi:hypothetical protein